MDINKQEENVNIEVNNEGEVENTNIENGNTVNIENTSSEDNSTANIENKVSFGDAFISTLVDIITTGLISVVGLFIFNAILKAAAGYYIKEVIPMFLIVYLIVALLYGSIMVSSKGADTIGKRVARLKVVKTQ
jgi:hypothetical protein